MENSWKFFLFMILICLCVQGFFAMVEMACVSFNKVRLQYYVSRQNKRALWLSYLLHHPALLFGTTLIGVNTALVVGSECARRFYVALGFSPDWAPLTQIFIVLIFAELAPMFAGRRYAEHVALLGIPILFFFSVILRPVIWLLDVICRAVNRLIGKPVAAGIYLSREELQNVIEEREETITTEPAKREFNTVVANIFALKNKTAKDLMQPITLVPLVPSFCTVGEMREIVRRQTCLVSADLPPHAAEYRRDRLSSRSFAPFFKQEDKRLFPPPLVHHRNQLDFAYPQAVPPQQPEAWPSCSTIKGWRQEF